MKAILKRPGKDAEVVEVENKTSVFEEMVGGEFWTMPYKHDVIFFCNKEDMKNGEKINFPFPFNVRDNIYGDVLFVGNGGHTFRGLREHEIDMVLKMLKKEKGEGESEKED